ncbi:hypothetical protein K0B04_01040 [Patescibacteria group bacterium]|nr:hypothetical protein [Patescibacteria group bacterium]
MTDNARGLIDILNTTSKTVFSTQDFNKLWKYDNYRSLVRRINYLKNSGKIIQLKRGLYAIKGRSVNNMELANKLRTPSYITFETVLFKEGIIFQWDGRITLASKESIKMTVGGVNMIFRQVKSSILFSSQGIVANEKYFIASKERALLDMIYIKKDFVFDNLRDINFEKLRELAFIYDRKETFSIITSLEEYARSY